MTYTVSSGTLNLTQLNPTNEITITDVNSISKKKIIITNIFCGISYGKNEENSFRSMYLLSAYYPVFTANKLLLSDGDRVLNNQICTVNPLKYSGIRWLHFKVFNAIQV